MIRTRFAVQPIKPFNLKGLDSGSILRPRIQLMAMGIPYDTPRATTEAEIMALNALLDPRKMQPKITTRATVSMRALRGSSRNVNTNMFELNNLHTET